ncbi:hypothetical protein M8C21_032000, partial [Ambrosia artemisiifolia]
MLDSCCLSHNTWALCTYSNKYVELSYGNDVLGEDYISFGSNSGLSLRRVVFSYDHLACGNSYAQRGDEIMALDCGDLILIAPIVTQLALSGAIATTSFAQELNLDLVSVSEAGDIKHHCHTSLTPIQTLPFYMNVTVFDPIREVILEFSAVISDSTTSVITHIVQNYVLFIGMFGIVPLIDDDTSMGIRTRTLMGLRTSSTNNVVLEFQVRDKRLCWKANNFVIILKSFFDLKSIQKLITSTKLCFCSDALHGGVVGAYANRIIVEALDAKESSLLNTLKSYLGPNITSFAALYGHKPPNIAGSICTSPDYSATWTKFSVGTI